jgi:hypothetical protein
LSRIMSREHLIDTQANWYHLECSGISAEVHPQQGRSESAQQDTTVGCLHCGKQDDWQWVLATWQGLSLGRSRLKKLGACVLEIGGPFPGQVVSVDSIRQTVTLRDPTDLPVIKPDVHVLQLRKYLRIGWGLPAPPTYST